MTTDRKREQRSWYIYDWANSAFASTVLTLFLGPYLTAIAKAAAESDGRVYPLGIPIDPRSWWGYLVSASVVLQVFCLPVVGAMADRSSNKKGLLGVLAAIGAGSTMALFFVQGTAYQIGGVLFLLANVAFGASVVVYNSFLPEIALPEERDGVSSRGWGIGYLGGGLVLALNLLLFTKAKDIGISEEMAVRISLCSAGVWWGLFTIVSLAGLRNRPAASDEAQQSAPLQFIRTLWGMRKYPQTMTFLLAYLLYNDAVQAVIAMAAQFGNDELKIPMSIMTGVILMVQFVAFFGAFVFEWVSRLTGTKWAIMISLFIWTGTVLSMYLIVRDTTGFIISAAVVALVLGGTQALSRGLFSQMIPKGREAEYFGVYEISDKGTSWMAPLVFALALQFSGNYRMAILSLIVFFVLGMIVLWQVDTARAAKEAHNSV